MRKLYQPHHRGVGDGLVFFFLFGFAQMDEEEKALVASEIPHVMDDIAALLKVGYTVVLDTEATAPKLTDALYSGAPDLSGLRTAGVYWSSHGNPDGSLQTHDKGTITPTDLNTDRIDRVLRLVVLCACHAANAGRGWSKAMGSEAYVWTWSGKRDSSDVATFLAADNDELQGLDNLIHDYMIEGKVPEARDDVDEAPATVAMAAVDGPLAEAMAAAAKAKEDGVTGVDEAAEGEEEVETAELEKPNKADGDAKKAKDADLANQVFAAFSGGKSIDDVIATQMAKHKILGGVAATVLPGLIGFAGKQAASKVKNEQLGQVIENASERASKAISGEEEEEQEVAEEAAEEVEEPAVDLLTREQLTERLVAAARGLDADVSETGGWINVKVPLSSRSHQVFTTLVGEGTQLRVRFHSNVGHLTPTTDLRGPLRKAAQASYARLAVNSDDRGDILVVQGSLPPGALNEHNIRDAIEEIAEFADGLEAWIFGADVN